MKLLNLSGEWEMKEEGSDKLLSTTIPGTVISTLLKHQKIPNPYYGENEKEVLPVFQKNYIFIRDFEIESKDLLHDKVYLRCEGLDTLADIYLNGNKIASTNNMHIEHKIECKDYLQVGNNRLEILFYSPVKYLEENPSKIGKPYSSLRKASCMFGWDWGIELPDSGIWRDISLEYYDGAEINHVQIAQKHHNGAVELSVTPFIEAWDDSVSGLIKVSEPDGRVLCSKEFTSTESPTEFDITNPQLWWPIGYGKQPLYTVEVVLICGEEILATSTKRIGLRRLVHSRKKMENGSEYAFIVNEKPIYFRGENMILGDAILSQTDEKYWHRLIGSAVKSNLNGIRVWGGAYYPPDLFYDLCDEAGLMVFQDFMFACSFYEINEAFCASVAKEATQNVKRICHHPSIALCCGNNEIDAIYTVANSTEKETASLRKLFGNNGDVLPEAARNYIWMNYSRIFLDILPKICEKWCPDTNYVHSSPSASMPGGATSFFDYLNDGDMHYYLQYHQNAPYQFIRNIKSRFMTEIGFQSYPSMKTIRDFSDISERQPDSSTMYAHQKCKNGNEAIEEYMRRDYIVPSIFNHYVYLSQLQAGEIMAYTVEHFRRDNEYNRGIILWQLNDCWPVVSWSGMDYYGRWKALQYFIKRFYAPVLVSVAESGNELEIWVSNEAPNDFSGTLAWACKENAGQNIQADSIVVNVAAGSSKRVVTLDCDTLLKGNPKDSAYFEYGLQCENTIIAQNTQFFCSAKDYKFAVPEIKIKIEEMKDKYCLDISTNVFAKRVMLDTTIGDCIFSDNWFDISAGTIKRIEVDKSDIVNISSLQDFEKQIHAICLNEVMS